MSLIKFSGHDEKTRFIGLGITAPTYSKMLQGQVMSVDLTTLGLPGHTLLIVAGRDNVSITRDLQTYIGRETNVKVDPAAIIGGSNG